MTSRALFPTIAASSDGIHDAHQASPVDTGQECMLSQSFGVSQMKFVPAAKAERTASEPPGKRFEARAGFPVMDANERNGKWSWPRGGCNELPDPLASSAKARHVFPVASRISTIVGFGRSSTLPSPEIPKVDPPMRAK